MGRKPVVQYVVEELARCGIGRLLFVTGPGKTAIENHFDIDAELINHLRETGKEELLEELAFERQDLEYFYTRQRRQLGLGHAVLCARPVRGTAAVRGGPGRFDHRPARPVGRRAEDDRAVRIRGRRRGDRLRGGARARRSSTTASPSRGAAGTTCSSWPTWSRSRRSAEAPSNLAVAARYVFSPAIFDYLAETKPGKGGRNPTDRRHPHPDSRRRQGAGRAPAARRAALRHRQFRELLPGLRRVRPGRPRLRRRPAAPPAELC